MAVTRIYLDTQQWTYCVEGTMPGWTPGGATDLRAAMLKSVNDGTFIFLGSLFHLEEISRTLAPYRLPILQFFWSVVRWNLLKPTVDLVPAEVAARGGLSGNDPFMTFLEQQAVKKFTLKSARYHDMAAEIAMLNAGTTTKFKAARDDVKAAIATKHPGFAHTKVTQEWFRTPEAILKSWADDYLESSQVRYGLPDDKSLWPDPVKLPTIRAMIYSNLARIYLQNIENRKIQDGDAYDSHHYAAASYADVFVTDDGPFRKVLELMRVTVRVMDFDEFAGLLGVSPH